jgi:hypothetical protein
MGERLVERTRAEKSLATALEATEIRLPVDGVLKVEKEGGAPAN